MAQRQKLYLRELEAALTAARTAANEAERTSEAAQTAWAVYRLVRNNPNPAAHTAWETYQTAEKAVYAVDATFEKARLALEALVDALPEEEKTSCGYCDGTGWV